MNDITKICWGKKASNPGKKDEQNLSTVQPKREHPPRKTGDEAVLKKRPRHREKWMSPYICKYPNIVVVPHHKGIQKKGCVPCTPGPTPVNTPRAPWSPNNKVPGVQGRARGPSLPCRQISFTSLGNPGFQAPALLIPNTWACSCLCRPSPCAGKACPCLSVCHLFQGDDS